MSVRRAAPAACCLVLCLAACASPGAPRAEPTPSSSASEPAADGRLRQYRGDAVRRLVQVTVTARSPLHVSSVELSSPGFAPLPPTPHDVVLPLGSPIDLPVRYGAAACDQSPGRPVATLSLVTGPPVTVELADDGLLTRLHDAECAEREILDQVDLRVDPELTELVRDGRPLIRTQLRLERRKPGRAVTIQELGANIVYGLRTDPVRTPVLVLGPEESSATVALELTPARCEAHALTESKATSLVLLYVRLDDDAPRLLTAIPDPATRVRLEEFAVRGCRA